MKQEIEKIENWLKTTLENTKKDGVVIGLSGGIDSTVMATIAVQTLGKDKVIGVLLPCYSSKESYLDAITLVEQLKINYWTMDLAPIFKSINDILPGAFFKSENKDLIAGNLKARLRMSSLYAIAQTYNCLVCGTTNRTEYLLGYYTKYGDGGTDIEPLLEYYKGDIKKMAKELNVSDYIINKAPAADLGISNSDEEELSKIVGEPITYEEIDEILKYAMEGKEPTKNISQKKIVGILKLNALSEHKRSMPLYPERDFNE